MYFKDNENLNKKINLKFSFKILEIFLKSEFE